MGENHGLGCVTLRAGATSLVLAWPSPAGQLWWGLFACASLSVQHNLCGRIVFLVSFLSVTASEFEVIHEIVKSVRTRMHTFAIFCSCGHVRAYINKQLYNRSRESPADPHTIYLVSF